MNDEQLENAKNAFFIALVIDMAVTAVALASDVWAIDVFKGIAGSGSAASQSVVGYIEFWGKFSALMLLTWLGVGWTLAVWLGACYTYAKESLKATGLLHERWRTWGWVIPGLNLFKPYQVLNEIYKVGGIDGAGREWKNSAGSVALLTWWIFWAISHLVLVSIGKIVLKSSSLESLTLSDVIGDYYVGIFACAVSLVVAGLWFAVAGSLTRRLQERGSKPFKSVVSTTTAKAVAGNDVYASALAEIEEGRLDKGVWARSFADSGGDESKAKALYIKARAESMQSAAVWQDTRPPDAEDAGVVATDGRQAASVSLAPVGAPLSAILILAGVAVVGILAAVALPAYQDYTKRQAVAANPVPTVQTGTDWNNGVITPPSTASAAACFSSTLGSETTTELCKHYWAPGASSCDSNILQELVRRGVAPHQDGCSPGTRPGGGNPQQVTMQTSPAGKSVSKVSSDSNSASSQANLSETKAIGFSAGVQAELNTIVQKAAIDFPYLDTPAGQNAIAKIVRKRDALIQQGMYPPSALTQAINDYAAANEPIPAKERPAEPVPVYPAIDKGNHPGFPPSCRWVTPQDWSCK